MIPFHCKSVIALCSMCFHLNITNIFGFNNPARNQLTRPYVTLSALTAKKVVKKKKPITARTTKGFGAPPPPPPTLLETLAKFHTRVPEDADSHPCPCGGRSDTEMLYGQCCGPLHRGERLALSSMDVLRSRYSAFSWRMIKYVMESTHESCADYLEDKVQWANSLNRDGMFDSFNFVQLEAGPEETGDNENEGYIEFTVTLRSKDNSILEHHADVISTGQETKVTERSKFIRDPNTTVWRYASGVVRSSVAGVEDVALNKPTNYEVV